MRPVFEVRKKKTDGTFQRGAIRGKKKSGKEKLTQAEATLPVKRSPVRIHGPENRRTMGSGIENVKPIELE